jgi:hypothetical protein
VELLSTNGFTLFQRRHVDGLQPGTVHHLPMPAKELETLGMPIYTFGGVGKEQSLSPIGGASLSRSFFPPSDVAIQLPNGELQTLHFPGAARRARSGLTIR